MDSLTLGFFPSIFIPATKGGGRLDFPLGVPSRKLIYPPKMAFWRWFSELPKVDQGGICIHPLEGSPLGMNLCTSGPWHFHAIPGPGVGQRVWSTVRDLGKVYTRSGVKMVIFGGGFRCLLKGSCLKQMVNRWMLVYAKITDFLGEGSSVCWKRILWKITGGKSTIWENELPNCSRQFKTRKYLLAVFSCCFFVGPNPIEWKMVGLGGFKYIPNTLPQETSPSPANFHQGQATFLWTPCDPSPPQATKVMKNCDVKEGKEKLGIILWKDVAKGTLQGTNISPKNGILKMIFLFPRWDMLIPWRVIVSERNHLDGLLDWLIIKGNRKGIKRNPKCRIFEGLSIPHPWIHP